MNLPNKLTLIRIFLIPVFTILLALDWPAGYLTLAGTKVALSWFIALIIFIVASLTDFADGQIARRKHLVTNFGKFAVTGLRLLLSNEGEVLAAAWPGKIKTNAQMFAIIFLMLNNAWFNNINVPFALILFYIAVFFTIYSGVEYFYKNRGVFKDSFGSSHQ